ncbi:uncharacterized protein BDZ99DRAFT_468813 [Mytilinidion resinicola]|uniref:DUF7779 domain-containing protein n=1 Tax=Mytilinidion resinicola TaxID=574789 RepID=A0A6A6Y1T0_9PEZI|nr:uncharacterized protein BDZ99DRAFT_468813 [Mytilinidion resinicola]KAF2802610.1 hypothetical protein BDZ99DRAFT_468813 [Mytilinidion resinicola]
MAGRQNLRANIFKLVHDWLRDCKDPWLLILDNVDDARFLLHVQADGQGQQPTDDSRTASRPLREYLPHCERGSIIVTTRNMDAALKLVERRDVITVEPMDEAQAQALFKKKLGVQGDDSDIAKLVAALEYMPLAIVQAAAYISEEAPRCSVVKYLDEFSRSERKRTSLLNHDKGQLRRDWEAKSCIIVTWQISFEHILQTRPSAADLLSLMSFFDRQGIPESVLRSRAVQRGAQLNRQDQTEEDIDSHEEDDTSQSSTSEDELSEDEFEEDVVALRNFCLISVNIDGTSFEMHALVQLATRKWLDSNGMLEQWKQHFISNLCAAFPTGQYENWVACQALFAHAKSAVGQRPEGESSLAEWATLLYRAAWYAEGTGNIPDAKEFALKSMKVRSRVLGQEHEDTLWSMGMVGSAYKLGGQWDAAEELEVQVMETREKKLGADHPSTLTSMANLASTYRNQGRWDAAEELFVQVMETRKKKLGADHPDTLTSMNNLAITWKEQGKVAEALYLLTECVRLCQHVFKPNHPHLRSSLATLERWKAEHLHSVAIRERATEARLGIS